MPYVKLDCAILDSTLWFDRDGREVFITALLMAVPIELLEPTPQLSVRTMEASGWMIPPGWYGFVPAAGLGIIKRAGVGEDAGLEALDRLGNPESHSRSQDHEGRRLVRVDGGYVALNFMRYRDKDHSSAVRSKRYRERKKAAATRVTTEATRVTDTQAVSSKQKHKQKQKEEEVGAPAADTVPRYTETLKRLPEDAHPAFEGLVRASRSPPALVGEIAALLDGMHGPAAPPEAVGLALRDLVLAGGRVTGNGLRAFVRSAMQAKANGATSTDPWEAARLKAEADDAARKD